MMKAAERESKAAERVVSRTERRGEILSARALPEQAEPTLPDREPGASELDAGLEEWVRVSWSSFPFLLVELAR